MTEPARWIDLLDPTRDDLLAAAPVELDSRALGQLLAPHIAGREPRPALEGRHDYVLGVLLAPVAEPEHDRLFYQEVDFVLTAECLVTVRKTPAGDPPFEPAAIREVLARHPSRSTADAVHGLVDEVAERYLSVVESLDDEIDELEERIEEWPSERVRARLSGLRHDLLHVRVTLSPTRDAVRRVVDGRLDAGGDDVFPRTVERSFADAHDKLLRATESLDLARDLLASARDHQQARIAHEQNEVVKKLTVTASLLLLPTFIVGVYGQNFEHMPELAWGIGYWFSWAVIVVSTLAQLAFFRWKKWL